MPFVIDYRPMFEDAERKRRLFRTAYRTAMRSRNSNEPLNEATLGIIKNWTYRAFQIHPEIRETMSGLNDQLKTMLDLGYLELSDKELTPFDPVTKDRYISKLFGRAFS